MPLCCRRQPPQGRSGPSGSPGIGDFFEVLGGGNRFSNGSSPTARSAARIVRERVGLPVAVAMAAAAKVEMVSLQAAVESLVQIQVLFPGSRLS